MTNTTKLICVLLNGSKIYDTKIYEHTFYIFESSSNSTILTPEGETKEDKLMFDDLIYNYPKVYNARTPEIVVEQVKQFIKKYKMYEDK